MSSMKARVRAGLSRFLPRKTFQGDYEPGFAAELMHKDLGLALNLGKEERVPLPLGALSHQIFAHLLSLGLGKKDTGVIFKVMEDLLGIQIPLFKGHPSLNLSAGQI